MKGYLGIISKYILKAKHVKVCFVVILASSLWLFLVQILSRASLNTLNSIMASHSIVSKNRFDTVLVDVTKVDGIPCHQNAKHIATNVSLREPALHNVGECFKISGIENGGNRYVRLLNESLASKFECTHVMYLGNQNIGRTGNQMFRVAALLGVASYHGYIAVITPSLSLTSWFDLPNVGHLKVDNVFVFREKSCCKYDDRIHNITHTHNWTINGYYQSYKYFTSAEKTIKGAFKIKESFARQATALINQTVIYDGVETVCIHVRRGDFTLASSQKRGYSLAPRDFIIRAMKYFREKYIHVHFFVVTDDKHWCSSNIPHDNVTISPFFTVGADMALMMQCSHVIVTSGSFGWWGAWLAGGDVVYWRGYPGNGTWLKDQTHLDDYYPEEWIGLN